MLARRDFMRAQSLSVAPDSKWANPVSVVIGSPIKRIFLRISHDKRWGAFKIAVNPQSSPPKWLCENVQDRDIRPSTGSG